MKKTLLLALAAVATIFTSCSSDIINDNDDSNNSHGKGMTLVANVEQPDTRATLDTKETFGTWSFAYTENDKVQVGNDQMDNNYYTFTKNGDNFSCADAKATNTDAKWFAYYPDTYIDLTNQDGKESAAKLYALAGATEKATTGTDGLTINMKAQAAVLRIVKVDNYGPCDIFLKTKKGKYVSGLKAKKDEAGFEVVTSDTKVPVFHKDSNGNAGIYYVIVPAGVYLEVWNEDRKFKTTSNGLNPGKYYTLTSGPTSGTATAIINGKKEKIEWVQMWIGGPRISVKNASDKMNFEDARKTGDNYIWGRNWRTPSLDEIKITGKEGEYGTVLNEDILNGTYFYKDNKHGFLLTGQQPGYNKNQLFLSGDDKSSAENVSGKFWLTDEAQKGYGTSINYYGDGENYIFVHPYTEDHNYSEYEVRPVLTIQTVKWNEQDIK